MGHNDFILNNFFDNWARWDTKFSWLLFPCQCITVSSWWARWRLKSPASRLNSTVHSGTDQRKHQSSTSLASVRGIHRWLVNSQHKWAVTRKMFPFDDVIMVWQDGTQWFYCYQARHQYLLNSMRTFAGLPTLRNRFPYYLPEIT